MSNTIGGISSTISSATSGIRLPPPRGARPDLSKVADEVFGKLDTGSKGYVDKADLQNAVEQLASSQKSNAATSAPSADDLLKAFDGNGDGKITKQEFSDGTKKLAEQFESQFNRSRTTYDLSSSSASNEAFTQLDTGGKGYLDKSDLENAARQAGENNEVNRDANGIPSAEDLLKALDTDSDGKITRQEFSSAFEKLTKPSGPPPAPPPGRAPGAGGPTPATSANSATTYEAADTNQDGTVSEPERIAYEISSAYIDSNPTSVTTQVSNADNDEGDNRTRQILQFLQSYARNIDSFSVGQNSSINITA